MNWLLIAVICIIAWNVVRGYTRGVLRMVYSLAAWIVMLAASTMASRLLPVSSVYCAPQRKNGYLNRFTNTTIMASCQP